MSTPATETSERIRLTVELEAALLRELRAAYHDVNGSFFKRKLLPAAIELADATSRLGRWNADNRTIEIARSLVVGQPWGVVMEVLKHEMAHQYVYEVLKVKDESAHGPAFRELCARLGIDAGASGMPSGGGATSAEDSRILERIARLLALAESSNVNEAQAAMNAAQRLMLKHNLESIVSRAPRPYGFRHVGKPTGRVSESERLLGTILGKHFFVEVIWVPIYRPLENKRGSVLEVCGTTTNLEMAAYVHAFLTHTSEQLWKDHQKKRHIRSNRDRRTYLAGVMAGFLEKLNEQRILNNDKGMVWVEDADLEEYYRRRHPYIQHVRHTGNRRTEAHAHGREAGRRIVLHKPVEGPRGSGGPKLLTR
jgi:hypothetical protein